MKCTLGDPATRPNFMPGVDKAFDSAWKTLLKKFPVFDTKTAASTLQVFTSQNEIVKQMSGFYYNLVDVLEVKDNVLDLLLRISVCGVKLEIAVNSELTRLYLELIANYFSMMYFLTCLPDLKAILALFNFLYEQANGKAEPSFGRMAERFTDSPEVMIKNLHLDVNPHSQIIAGALASLGDLFGRRLVRAQNWRDGLFLDILSEPTKITHTALSDQLSCELLPYEVMERWVIFGYLVIYPTLTEDDDAFSRLRLALRNSYVVVLYRDEVVHVHSLLTSFLETVWTARSASKRLNDIKESLSIACSQAPGVHSDRRSYLRTALRQLHSVLADQPGLLGPKAFIVFWGLSYATDEIHWLLRHSCNLPLKKSVNSDDLNDLALPELLFYVEDLRNLLRTYSQVIQRFHIQLLSSYDAPGLEEYLRPVLSRLPIDEVEMFNGMLTQLHDVGDGRQTLDRNAHMVLCDFSGLRLDWLRLQATLSAKDSPLNLCEYPRLAEHLHSTVFHTKLVDQLDDLLRQVCDLSIFYFYRAKFEEIFIRSLNIPSQLRYTGVFPTLCTYFTQASHDLCPKERFHIGCASAALAKKFCADLVDAICTCLFNRMDEICALVEQLAPQNAVAWLPEEMLGKKREAASKSAADPSHTHNGYATMRYSDRQGAKTSTSSGSGSKGGPPVVKVTPGAESFRRDRAEQTQGDRTLFTLSQLCFALTYRRDIQLPGEVFDPRMILQSELQSRLFEGLNPTIQVGVAEKTEPAVRRITKPTEMLRRARALMEVLIEVEDFVRIDVVTVFTNVFGQHTQPREPTKNLPTLTSHYAEWYSDVFMRHAYMGHFVYSPLLKSFVSMVSSEVVRFRAEDYADLNELRALAELIGPTGMRHICSQLVQQVGSRIDEVKKLVLQNRSTLEELRGSFDDPVKTRQLAAQLLNVDTLLSYLKEIGIALAFQSLCQEAVGDVLQSRTPFLVSTAKRIKSFMLQQAGGKLLPPSPGPNGLDANGMPLDYDCLSRLFDSQLLTANLCSAMGLPTELDPGICHYLRSRRQLAASTAAAASGGAGGAAQVNGGSMNLDYHVACLFIVFAANALPQLARAEGCKYHINLEANEGNIHCIAYAVTAIMIAMFSVLNPGDLEERSTEFLALASSNLLRLGLETSSSLVSAEISGTAPLPQHHQQGGNSRNRDAVYLLFDQIVRLSPFLTASLQEACFPYALIRSAYHHVACHHGGTATSAAAGGGGQNSHPTSSSDIR
ncbi:hypothetical protein AAHC03_0160 [Spirometra sp. Aus1]